MERKLRLICTAGFFTLTFFPAVGVAAQQIGSCTLPQDLGDEVSTKYAGMRIVTLADLDDYKKKLFQKDHGKRCPGLVRVDFFGDGKPTWALVLISGENPKRKAQLVVAHLVDKGWETRPLETTDGTPVVWREGPGKYEGMYDPATTIRAKYPVIVFCGYGSWAVLYSWTGKEVEKVWLSD